MVDLLLESALRSLALGGAIWLGLTVLRVRNPRVQMTAWTVVLAAALAMPVLMDRVTVTMPATAPPLRVVEQLLPRSGPLEVPFAEVPAPSLQGPDAAVSNGRPSLAPPAATEVRVPRLGSGSPSFGWQRLAAAVYIAVAGVMVLRLVTGLLLSLRIARSARPLREGWARGADIRVSDTVAMPVTFGSTVLLPTAYVGWSEDKRQTVLSHELSHVAHGDFYVLLLAAVHRAVFWFNPLAWWQLVRMAELAEIISDDAVLEMLDDRPSYAG
ncbi:MAG: M56 family metallopeptidase, partial [Bradyrhizobiaceae bacterium]|nr:M56 family metallopeptidase [Bradyrhizobiaceae bacterium]